MAVAAAARGPEERATFRQEAQLVVQRHPAVAALLDEVVRAAVRGSDPSQQQASLVAALPLHGERTRVGEPVDAREIAVAGTDGVDARRLRRRPVRTVADRCDEELHLGIRPSGRGVALADHPHAVGEDLEALEFVDRGFVDAREGDQRLVRRPPVAGAAVHFLLRDELGDAELQRAAAAAADRALSRRWQGRSRRGSASRTKLTKRPRGENFGSVS